MKTSSLITLICCVFVINTCQAQIGAKTQQGKIHGIWHNNEFGYQMTLILNTDGTGEFDGDAIKFTVQGNKLTMHTGETVTYTFTLQGNSLTVSEGDLERPVTFTRQGATQVSGKQTSTETSSAIPKNLLGAWSGYGETIEFKPDGQCIYRGQPFPYTVSGNYITLQTTQGNVMMAYAITGNQITLTINGQNVVYTKGSGTTKSGSTTSGKPAGSGKLDLSLVGKWCYINVTSTNSGGSSTDECITLREDGSYEYYSERSMSVNSPTVTGGTASQDSDRGTWWVEGDRVHYNSQTQGPGSYQLQKQNHPKTGDPMIVLEGRAYVTFYQKAPW